MVVCALGEISCQQVYYIAFTNNFLPTFIASAPCVNVAPLFSRPVVLNAVPSTLGAVTVNVSTLEFAVATIAVGPLPPTTSGAKKSLGRAMAGAPVISKDWIVQSTSSETRTFSPACEMEPTQETVDRVDGVPTGKVRTIEKMRGIKQQERKINETGKK